MKSLLFVILSALISLGAASITVGKCPVYGANNPDFDPTLVNLKVNFFSVLSEKRLH